MNQQRRIVWTGAAVVASLLSVCAAGQDVPYVRSPEYVVERMLKLADVKADDVVYDLGCGDGRICIAASKTYGCRSVGIDIDPNRVREANNFAKRAGVTDKTKFITQDVLDSRFDDATVVCLYMLREFNIKLRPRLLAQLKPGTRVVAHTFGLGDWKPDRTERLPGVQHEIFLWVVPAKVDGQWDCTLKTPAGERPAVLNLRQTYQEVTGTVSVGGETYPLTNPVLVGDRLSFEVVGTKRRAAYSLKLDPTTRPTSTEEEPAATTRPVGDRK
jgi:SAM-dependent methyltransferase